MQALSVLFPVYNEETILESSVLLVHAYLKKNAIEHEILVTSNGSTDATVVIGEKLAAEHEWLKFFALEERSVGAAFVHGVTNARNEYLVSLDVDLSSDLIFLVHAHKLLEGCDFVAGSKTLGQQNRSAIRMIGSQLYIFISQLCLGLPLTDYSIGCKAFRRSAILPALPHLSKWTGYILELSLYLPLQNKRVIQIGIQCNDTRSSRFNLFHEAFFRYWHLFRSWRLLKDQQSWLHQSLEAPKSAWIRFEKDGS